jgi:hypothetical protein
MNEYDEQAQRFLDKYKLTFQARLRGAVNHCGGKRNKFWVEISRVDQEGKKRVFGSDFYDSIHNYERGVNTIRPYDFLAAISGDQDYTSRKAITDSFGDDLSGIDVPGLIEQAKQMKAFFTPAMLKDLDEIR